MVSGCAERGTCPAARAHHPTFSSVTHPPHTPAAISFQALGIKSGCSPNSVLLCAPPSDSGGSLPHPHPPFGPGQFVFIAWSASGSLQNTSASPRRTAGPLTAPPPALKRIRSGVREESLLRGPPSSLFPPRPLVPSSPISPIPSPSPPATAGSSCHPHHPCQALPAEPAFPY